MQDIEEQNNRLMDDIELDEYESEEDTTTTSDLADDLIANENLHLVTVLRPSTFLTLESQVQCMISFIIKKILAFMKNICEPHKMNNETYLSVLLICDKGYIGEIPQNLAPFKRITPKCRNMRAFSETRNKEIAKARVWVEIFFERNERSWKILSDHRLDEKKL
jgi:hypothetical protein